MSAGLIARSGIAGSSDMECGRSEGSFYTGKVAFFVMVGHSFGLVSAVYNYSRCSAAIADILRRVFTVVACL